MHHKIIANIQRVYEIAFVCHFILHFFSYSVTSRPLLPFDCQTHYKMPSQDEEKEKKKMDIDEDDQDEEESEKVDPILEAAGLCSKFTLLRQSTIVNDKSEEDKILKQLMQIYDENNMIEFYRNLCTQNSLNLDESLISKWTKNKTDLLQKNAEKKKEAETNEGDVEIHEAEIERAHILALTADCKTASNAFLEIKGLTTGKQIDSYLAILRLALAWNDDHFYKKHMQETEKYVHALRCNPFSMRICVL